MGQGSYILRKLHDPVIQLRSKTFNIDNGSGTTDDDVLGYFDQPVRIVSARLVYVEATDTSGAASATLSLGTTAGGVDLVAATACEVLKAVGSVTELTIAKDYVPANTAIFARHTGIAATEGGQYWVEVEVALA